ncbi:MAG: terpene cyclase/mutase family protein [Kiritimatiellaeota bacterium]|nr:terpene cyclase/mutase family protein [Kiritimatiellota bacterium]
MQEASPQIDAGGEIDYAAILEDYRRRQMLEHLAGPVISVVLHIVLITACAIFLVQKPRKIVAETEINMEKMVVKELDPKVLEKLRKLEEIPEDVVPTVEKPDIPTEAAADVQTEDFDTAAVQTDADVDLTSVLDIKPNQTPLKLSALYSTRTTAGRQTSLKKFGGSYAGESAVIKALEWLKRHQNPDGSWSKSEPLGMAGLATLAFLAHGETPLSKQYGRTVQKALQYLANQLNAQSEDLPLKGKGTRFAYRNGIATYALAEGYGLTKIPFLKPAMEKGLSFIVRGQMPIGGWNYGYSKGNRWDLSVSGWQIQALKSGYVAGANVPGMVEAIEKAVKFLKKTAFRDGLFRYSSDSKGGGSLAMQGTGTLCLQLLGEAHSRPVRTGIKTIFASLPNVIWAPGKAGNTGHGGLCYAWYYETQAMFHAGQSYWRRWNRKFTTELVRHQKPDGHWESPWTPAQKKDRNWEFDPYYSTALSCLMLEVYYRYLPTYKLPKAVAKGPSLLDVKDDDLGLEIE